MESFIKNTLVCLIICIMFSCSDRPEKLTVSTREINLGAININETTECEFTVYNPGQEALKILDYTCSCECTVPDALSTHTIPPQDSLSVKMNVRPNKSDRGQTKRVVCTFRSDADSAFSHIYITYTGQ